ncbi:MAG: STAS domain-containing protein [Marmoricola sp.]
MADFTSSTTCGADGCTITLAGEVDIATVGDFLDAAQQCLAGNATLIEVDLGGVTFIDSSGLGALVRLRNQARSRGADVALVRVPETVARVLEVTGLAEAFGPEG